mmetsp:Transcript_79448/g.157940  ORF Transcript_79448/g.157940 Transcript_79448/m.157940 type:complete len:223 (-) Transcript_79448:949-1617(-)
MVAEHHTIHLDRSAWCHVGMALPVGGGEEDGMPPTASAALPATTLPATATALAAAPDVLATTAHVSILLDPQEFCDALDADKLCLDGGHAHHEVHRGALECARIEKYQAHLRRGEQTAGVQDDASDAGKEVQNCAGLHGEGLCPLLHRLCHHLGTREVGHPAHVLVAEALGGVEGTDRLAAGDGVGVVRKDGRVGCGGDAPRVSRGRTHTLVDSIVGTEQGR